MTRPSSKASESGLSPASTIAIANGASATQLIGVRIWLLWRTERREGTPEDDWLPWLGAAHDLTFVYLAFATLWWQPWYLVWLVALAALLPSRVIHERALLFCYGATLNYLVFKYIWPVFQPMTYTTIMGISVIMIFGLVFLHLAWSIGMPRPKAPSSDLEAAPSLRA